ncbi:ATP-dependent Zn protease [Aster yellows witches'-broom phytoplasma AYWB]|uniref:ATP-dependent Zn protease n=1 Tax=Aster yellows witches'-broom phytoplasma (strain AYWB) TaxID=322098 RepID=Q2NJK1_AYWBP|nr:ATP-binding protein [Aster yellows witches'-broom phytoplasma]ABC65392.1 ATP-dependent Zn protease [Aster yellows witches'-broom phytoplasma AYWB]
MKTLTKIYLSFLSIFVLILIVLFIIGLTKSPFTTNNNQNTPPNTHTHHHEEAKQNNKELNPKEKEALSEIQTRLQELELFNQKNIEKSKKIKEEDNILSQQINSNLAKINTLNQEINTLKNQLEEKTNQLNNKQTNLTNDEKTKLENDINAINQEITKTTQKRDKINDETKSQTKKRVENTQSQLTNQNKIQTTKLEIDKTTNFKDIYQKINTLQQSINYNNANKEQIKELITQHQDDPQEIQNLKSYDLFLDGQLIQFEKQIKQLKNEIEIIQNPNTPKLEKKKVTFKDVYGMEREKEELEDLIYYLKDDNNDLVNYDKIKPKGYLLYGPPGTGKSFLMKALCNETEAHFIEFEPSKLDKTYVGEGNEEWEKIWKEAESHGKAIIFIDEISGLANREDKNTNKTSQNIINNILTKLDGFNSNNKKIVLMGATNYLNQIDKALRSRFSKEIKIDLIKDHEIEDFLKFLITPYQISYHTYIHLNDIANKCKGKNYSNRDLTTIINEAYNKTNKYKSQNKIHEVMLPSDLDEAIDVKQNKNKNMNDIKKRRKECEEQYTAWKQGIIKYLKPPKDQTMIKRTYTFYGLYGLGRGHHREHEPADLALFVKNPFDKWYDEGMRVDEFDGFYTKEKQNDSQFGGGNGVRIDPSNHYIKLKYEGPKHLIEEDKDFFMDEVNCTSNERSPEGVLKSKTYYLHFNPKQGYITLYTQKHNTKENK